MRDNKQKQDRRIISDPISPSWSGRQFLETAESERATNSYAVVPRLKWLRIGGRDLPEVGTPEFAVDFSELFT